MFKSLVSEALGGNNVANNPEFAVFAPSKFILMHVNLHYRCYL